MPELQPTVTVRMKGMEPGVIPEETGLGEIQEPAPVPEVPTVPTETIEPPAEFLEAPEMLGDPAPFDIDGFVNEWNRTQPMEKAGENRDSFAKTMYHFAKPFLAPVTEPIEYGKAVLKANYNATAALNRGAANLFTHWDGVRMFLEQNLGVELPNLFKDLSEISQREADYLQKKANEDGDINFLDEIITEAVGSFVPGVLGFAVDVASVYSIPYMDGYYKATTRSENPFVAGILEAAKTKTLYAIFKMMEPLSMYLKIPSFGTVFGIQGQENAPEGKKLKTFVKDFAIGAGYAMTSPGGRMGLNEVSKNFQDAYPKFMEKMKDTTGAVGEAPQKRPRKFLKTVSESTETDPALAEKVKEIDPQDYVIETNAKSKEVANKLIDEMGVDAALDFLDSDKPPSAIKGTTAIVLMERFQRDGNFDQAVRVLESYDRQLREAGRFVQAASLWNRLSPQGFIRWANKQLDATREKYGWADTLFRNKPEAFTLSKDEQKDIMVRMREINEMPDGIDKADATLQLIDTIAQKVPPSVSEMFDAYRYQNMLSSPRTHMRNIGENIFNTFISRPADITTKGAIDWTKSILFGSDRVNYVRDAAVYEKAAINAVPNAVKAFVQTIRMQQGATITKPETGVEAKTEFERARAKQLPTSLTLVSRFMEACDKFNAALIAGGEIAIAKRKGLSDAEAYEQAMKVSDSYLYREKLDPTDPRLSYPSEVLSSLGKMMEGSRKLPGLGKLSKWYMPFIKTPINKGIQMVERSPLGAIRGNLDSDAMAKILSGSIVTALGAIMAAEGETTWAPPTNKEEKEWFYATGRKPFSFRIPSSVPLVGDTWVPLWYTGPYALALGIPMAVKHYTQDTGRAMTADAAEKLFDVATGIAQFVGSQSSTQSIGALFSALGGDIDYKLSSQTAFTVEQIIPATSLIRFINTIVDPVYRKPQGFMEQIEKDLPWLSQNLNARMTPFMQESKRETVNYFLPYDVGTVKPEYEAIYPFKQVEARQKHIESKTEALLRKMKDKSLTPSEAIKEYLDIQRAAPKVFEPLKKKD